MGSGEWKDEGDEGDEGGREVGRSGGGEKIILLSPHLPIPLSPHPLLMPHAQCPIPHSPLPTPRIFLNLRISLDANLDGYFNS